MGAISTSRPISPRYAIVNPTYIGFLVMRYGPCVTSAFEAWPGMVVVRALWNSRSPHPAMIAPIMNKTAPQKTMTCVILAERCRRGKTVSRSPTPAKYPRTNTQGTGTRMRTRENGDRLATVVEIWFMPLGSITLAADRAMRLAASGEHLSCSIDHKLGSQIPMVMC